MQQFHNVAIIGADNQQSQQLIELLEQHQFPLAQLFALALEQQDDEASALKWQGQAIEYTDPQLVNWSEVSVAWLLSNDEAAIDLAEQACQTSTVVIDVVGVRQEAQTWLHAGVNPEQISESISERWLTCPSSLAGQLALLLHIIQQDVELERVEVNAMLSAANKGKAGVDELAGQTARLLNGLPVEPAIFSQQLAFNILPESAEEGSSSDFEQQLSEQCRALLRSPELMVNVSAQHVPVFYGDCLSIHLYAAYSLDLLSIREWLSEHPAFDLVEDEVVTPVNNIANNQSIVISRLRQNPHSDNGVNLSLMANNPLTGQLSNALQLAEILVKQYI